MKTDIVFPSGNEKEMAAFGAKLGFEKLIFIYPSLSRIKQIPNPALPVQQGVLVEEKNKKNLVKTINKIKQKGFLVLIRAQEDSFNRFVLERTRADMIFGLEKAHTKDAMHYRRSGLDQILCRIVAAKGKKIVFDFGEVLEPLFLGRIIQNIKFCRKFRVDFLLASFARRPEEMKGEQDLRMFEKLLQQKFL